MHRIPESTIINQTCSWVEKFVIAHNFCPFANSPYSRKRISYLVDYSREVESNLTLLNKEFLQLNENIAIDTSFIIYPLHLESFEEYLDFLTLAEIFLSQNGYEGIYQLASFHPHYLFEGSDETDAANYTNRSPYPMLHILREDQVEKAHIEYKDVDQIPENNIKLTRKLGLIYFQELFKSLFK